MSTEDKTIAKTLAEAISALPDGKREYLIGYAEGVAAMAEAAKERTNGETEPPGSKGGDNRTAGPAQRMRTALE